MRPKIVFQPYDRVTGTELSQHEQNICRAHYWIVKTYIDGVESRANSSLTWTRKQLRCSTRELLEFLQDLVNDIRKATRADIKGKDGTTNIQIWAEAEGSKIAASEPGSDPAASERYQQAINLLHELVGRLADVEEIHGRVAFSQGWLTLGSSHRASEASMMPSTVPTSTESDTVVGSDYTRGPNTSDEVAQKQHPSQELPEFETFDPFDEHPEVIPSNYNVKKEKAINDWVVEYLRGGWLSHSSKATDSTTASPLSPTSEDNSPFGSFGPPRRTTSDNMSTYSDDSVHQASRGGKAGARVKRRGRPIPTVASRLQNKGGTDMPLYNGSSIASGFEHFKTPRSVISGDTIFCTPDGGCMVPLTPARPSNTSAWNKYLRQKGLIPTPFEEMDWSGRGQHAEFDASEESEIPLLLEKNLGYSSNAVVESVRCKRIRLARKTIRVTRRLRKEEAMQEVEHLQRLKHSHIIRVVGTYTLPRTISILVYPVAEYTLDQFLEAIEDDLSQDDRTRLSCVSTFLRCLAKAVAYIHDNAMKHMDIKPKNLLVRDMRNSIICNQGNYKIYIADFGITRSYESIDDCNTESPTAYTKTYAAPEVVAQERRDQKADIFSLGAVFAEMLAVLATRVNPHTSNLDALHAIRESDPIDRSYATHAKQIQQWIRPRSLLTYGFESESDHSHITELVARMLSLDPAQRPTAATIVNNIPFLAFCCDVNGGCEPFETAEKKVDRQLYDRAMEIAEVDARYWRCMVEGCVKVYLSWERMEYHTLYGHGQKITISTEFEDEVEENKTLFDRAYTMTKNEEQIDSPSQRSEWSTF